jgi:hypothetical protein
MNSLSCQFCILKPKWEMDFSMDGENWSASLLNRWLASQNLQSQLKSRFPFLVSVYIVYVFLICPFNFLIDVIETYSWIRSLSEFLYQLHIFHRCNLSLLETDSHHSSFSGFWYSEMWRNICYLCNMQLSSCGQSQEVANAAIPSNQLWHDGIPPTIHWVTNLHILSSPCPTPFTGAYKETDAEHPVTWEVNNCAMSTAVQNPETMNSHLACPVWMTEFWHQPRQFGLYDINAKWQYCFVSQIAQWPMEISGVPRKCIISPLIHPSGEPNRPFCSKHVADD